MRPRRQRRVLSVLAALAAAVLFAAPGDAAAQLAVGDPAPPFALRGTDGEVHRLEDSLGERGVVLAWFPKAFTPGCTAELGSLRDRSAEIADFAVDAYMVSLDDVDRNRAFAESLDADLVLLSDPDQSVARAYGVVSPVRPYPHRWTFFIDPSGTIVHIDGDVTPETAGEQIVLQLERLGFPKRSNPPAAPASERQSP